MNPLGRPRTDPRERFRGLFTRQDGHWLWQGAISRKNNTPTFWNGDRLESACRFAYRIWRHRWLPTALAQRLIVRPSCGEPLCVRPKHQQRVPVNLPWVVAQLGPWLRGEPILTPTRGACVYCGTHLKRRSPEARARCCVDCGPRSVRVVRELSRLLGEADAKVRATIDADLSLESWEDLNGAR